MEISPERELRKITVRIGAAFIVNIILLFALMSTPSELSYALADDVTGELTDGKYAAVSVVESALYMLCFMLPVLFFRLITPKDLREPMRLCPAGGFDSLLLVFAGVGLVFSAATLNSFFFSFVDFSVLYDEGETSTPVGLVCSFMATALVPAVCEEFLYRGCFLSNLLPYGRTTAIIGSALLFALMHGNLQQYLYTFCAGLVLGLAYTESGSIIPPLCIHLVNNFASVAEEEIYYSYGGESALMVFEIVVFLGGLGALAWYVFGCGGRLGREGAAGIDGIRSRGYALPSRRREIPPTANRVKLFFSPTVIIGAALSLTEAVAIIAMALIYQ